MARFPEVSKGVIALEWVNSLPNDKAVDLSKLKPFAGDKLKNGQVTKLVFDRVENIVEKRRKCLLTIFSP